MASGLAAGRADATRSAADPGVGGRQVCVEDVSWTKGGGGGVPMAGGARGASDSREAVVLRQRCEASRLMPDRESARRNDCPGSLNGQPFEPCLQDQPFELESPNGKRGNFHKLRINCKTLTALPRN